MGRTLKKPTPVGEYFLDHLTGAIANPAVIESTDIWSDEIWEEQPVDVETFCEEFVGEGLFPIQAGFAEETMGSNPMVWDDKYYGGIAYWGKGCVSGDTILKDEKTGKEYTIKELAESKKSIYIKSLKTYFNVNIRKDRHQYIIKKTGIPFKKGVTELFKVRLKSGKEIIVSKEHKFYTSDGWKKLKDLKIGSKLITSELIQDRLTSEQELQRRNKISNTLKGIKKTPEHILNMKNVECSSRFKNGHIPNFTGADLSEESKDKIRQKLLGKKLSCETRRKMSIANKGMKHHKDDCLCICCKTKRGEFKVYRRYNLQYNGYTFRSSWEVKFAVYLDGLGIKWEYEPESFKLSSGISYIPDFYLSKYDLWIELKGFSSFDGKQKMDLFEKEYNKKLIILYKDDLNRIGVGV